MLTELKNDITIFHMEHGEYKKNLEKENDEKLE